MTTRMKFQTNTCRLLVMFGLTSALCLSSSAAFAQENRVDQEPGPGEQQQQQQQPRNQAPNDQAAPPRSLTLPAGTVIRVRLDEWLSSDRNLSGDSFSASLDQPVVVDGWVVARRGQSETGTVTEAKKAGRVSGTSQLGVQLDELTLVDGQQVPLQTQLIQTSGGTSHGQDAAAIGTTTGVGAAIGGIANGGEGAGIGAGIGAAAGIIGVLATRGKPTMLPAETVLSFKLQSPVTISTERSEFAFQPVNQDDYDTQRANNRPPQHRANAGGPEYPPPPYGYPYAYAYPYAYGYYPAPFYFGYYRGYRGYGPRFGYRGRWR